MNDYLAFFTGLMSNTLMTVITTLIHNWLPLLCAILISAAMRVYVDTEKLREALLRRTKISILASVAVGAFTPLCACGTMAVVVGMLTATLPWGPVMAFLTSSPLMSPEGFIMLAGVINVRFAIALAVASVIIGLGSGYGTFLIEKNTGFLKNQTRFSGARPCGCGVQAPASAPAPASARTCDPRLPVPNPCALETYVEAAASCAAADCRPQARPLLPRLLERLAFPALVKNIVDIGIRQILLYFSIFVAVGYLINYFIPTSYIIALFRPGSILSVPLAAIIGLPLYVTGEAAIPLVKAFMDQGAGGGAMMAFLITGPATSAWVIAGITAFMKRKVISLYVAFILGGGILMGYLYELLLK